MTLRLKMFIGYFGIVLFFILLTWFLNSFLLKEFYVYKNKGKLLDYSKEIDNLYNGEVDLVKSDIYNLERKYSINLFIINQNGSIIYTSRKQKNLLPPNPLRRDSVIGKGGRVMDGFQPLSPYGKERQNILPKVFHERKKLEKEKYIYDKHFDRRIRTSLLEIIYVLKNNEYLILSKPLEIVNESAIIAIQFSMFSGLLTLIFGFCIALYFSKKFSFQIHSLSEIAGKIANLDFSKKFNVKTKDEIGKLGNSINYLSDELNKSITELKVVNKKLTKEIEHERKLEKMRKEFVSSVSHELKTPISLIQGYSMGLKTNVVKDEKEKEFYCDVIIDESNKMNKLVMDLLDLSQIESGNFKIDPEIFDLSLLTKNLIEKFRVNFKEKEIKIESNIKDNIKILGDKRRIDQVITNFISNALNHVDEKKIINISITKKDNKAKLSVENSGKNISKDHLNRLWESFYKIDKARTRKYGGTGLGLAIVKGILDQHKYSFGVENLKKGVSFWFLVEIKSN